MSRRRRPPGFYERLVRSNESFAAGSLGGYVRNASPVLYGPTDVNAADSGSVASSATIVSGSPEELFAYDHWTLAADGAQTKTLSQDPIDESVHVYLNGIVQLEGTDWSVSSTTLSILTAMDALTGDSLSVRYAYTVDIPPDSETG